MKRTGSGSEHVGSQAVPQSFSSSFTPQLLPEYLICILSRFAAAFVRLPYSELNAVMYDANKLYYLQCGTVHVSWSSAEKNALADLRNF